MSPSSRFLCPWDSPGKDTGVDCHSFLQGIFQTQESNLSLLHWQVDSLPLSHQGSLLTELLFGNWLNYYLVIESESLSVVPVSLQLHGPYSPWNSPGQKTGVGCLFLLQGIFPTQELNPGSHIVGEFFTSWATREPNRRFILLENSLV